MEYLQWGDISCDKGGVGSLRGGGLVKYVGMQLGSYVGGLKWLPLGLDFISGWVKDRFIIVGENISLGLGGGGLMFWNLQYFRFLKGVQYA